MTTTNALYSWDPNAGCASPDIHERPTVPCPAPSRAMLAAARRHDSRVSAAVMVRPPRSARPTVPGLRSAARVAIATAALLLTPLLARGAEPTVPSATACKRVVVMQETTGSGDTTIVVRTVCTTEK